MLRPLRPLRYVRLRDFPLYVRSVREKARAIQTYRQTQSDFARRVAGMAFTTAWFLDKIPLWMVHVITPTAPDIRYLEIGAWEGMSALFVRTMKPQATLTCIDTWEGSDEQRQNRPDTIGTIERSFDANIGNQPGVTKLKGLSSVHLGELVARGETFDVIYVDGSHHSHDVMVDCLLAWKLLRNGGVMIGDDNFWSFSKYRRHELPNSAYRHFRDLIKGDYCVLSLGKQIFLRKELGAGANQA